MNGPQLKFANDVTVKDGVITAVLSTEAVDRDGDVVRLAGWDLSNFETAPRLMSCHDYGRLTSQIGEWRNVRVDPARKALIGEPHYYTNQGNPEADWGYYLASIGQATYSVGFNPLASEPRKGARGGSVFTEQELLECSHVPIPANQEAVQLMAKAFRQRAGQPQQRRQPGQTVQKWDSNFMGDDGDFWGPKDVHCIVAGCDDASQINIPICSEHLQYLMQAPAEPPDAPPDDDDLPTLLRTVTRVFGGMSRRKAGRVMSSTNLTKLHGAMQALKDVHDASCDDDDCPVTADGDPDDEPPTQADKGKGQRQRAAGDKPNPFIAGGVQVSASGTHGAVDGDTTHSHAHSAAGDQGDDASHDHSHAHADGTSSHSNADHTDAHKAATPAGERTAFDLAAALEQALAGITF